MIMPLILKVVVRVKKKNINIDDEDSGDDPYEGSAMEIENEILNDINYLTMDHVKSAEHTLQNQNSSSRLGSIYYIIIFTIILFFF